MLFHEIYGCYYQAVAAILSRAVRGELVRQDLERIAGEKAFAESFLTIAPALESGKWQLLLPDLTTPLAHEPTLPLTLLEKRWLKAVSLDPRVRLFRPDTGFLEGIEPLFTPEDYVAFDRYGDGDPYEDERYIAAFSTVLQALLERKRLCVRFTDRKGDPVTVCCVPEKLEYSEKDDKFRLLTTGCRHAGVINLGRIRSCEIVGDAPPQRAARIRRERAYLTLELTDERNALERALLHFAQFEREAERLGDKRYRVTLRYDRADETELVVRVLSFGPLVKVVEPEGFVQQIKERLRRQKSCGLS